MRILIEFRIRYKMGEKGEKISKYINFYDPIFFTQISLIFNFVKK